MELSAAPAAVPRCFPGQTIVCLGGGPSLSRVDVEACRGRARVVCVNDAIRLAPWADVLYAADARFWMSHQETKLFTGLKFGLQPCIGRADVTVLRNTGRLGLELDPTGLRTGGNSGYQAIGLANHLGASTIILLGYDMRRIRGRAHWFGSHVSPLHDPSESQLVTWRAHFATLVGPLTDLGITIVNATPDSALTCFPQRPLRDALGEVAACA
jgi:hypothetical protein